MDCCMKPTNIYIQQQRCNSNISHECPRMQKLRFTVRYLKRRCTSNSGVFSPNSAKYISNQILAYLRYY